MPTKTIADVNITDYKCIVLPGTINPLPALYDDRLIEFLRGGINTDVTFAAISSSPILLAKAGVLDGRKFTAGFFMQMAETFSFVENENFIHKGIVCDGNVITGIGMFFREFAETVLHKFGYDVGSNFMCGNPEDYTEEELTFYWSEEDYLRREYSASCGALFPVAKTVRFEMLRRIILTMQPRHLCRQSAFRRQFVCK